MAAPTSTEFLLPSPKGSIQEIPVQEKHVPRHVTSDSKLPIELVELQIDPPFAILGAGTRLSRVNLAHCRLGCMITAMGKSEIKQLGLSVIRQTTFQKGSAKRSAELEKPASLLDEPSLALVIAADSGGFMSSEYQLSMTSFANVKLNLGPPPVRTAVKLNGDCPRLFQSFPCSWEASRREHGVEYSADQATPRPEKSLGMFKKGSLANPLNAVCISDKSCAKAKLWLI
ncbi:hypothetical protein L211DRAFT_844868 [Terfezia boudieri ATCC MYA-4762]|uniref:Uncharacterized protein n=1 Tax=Terfezia boudieri ATCC MYA-4762 TaxID=1051890 RepID=A0A3N4MKK1_9PEZI|nr:hypothetical protein L211DRAFT_844868 [Terfezia boudieri ATCC MYA-4762]